MNIPEIENFDLEEKVDLEYQEKDMLNVTQLSNQNIKEETNVLDDNYKENDIESKIDQDKKDIIKQCIKIGPNLPCMYCDKKFNKLGTRNEHIKVKHPEMKFKCNFCDKDFVEKGNLEKHEKWHSKPKMCEICDIEFSTGKLYRSHIIEKHEIEGKKFCSYCDYIGNCKTKSLGMDIMNYLDNLLN